MKNTDQETTPWDSVNADSVGPWTFTDHTGKERVLNALAIMDPATGSFESCRTRNPSSLEANQLFDTNWLCKHPKPRKVICDQGLEFELEFVEPCESHGMKRVTSFRKYPPINSRIERTHLVTLSMLRALESSNAMWDDEDRIWDACLAKLSWAARSARNTALKCAPGELAFNRDMTLQSQRLKNWDITRNNKHNVSVRNNLQESKKRSEWECHIGDKVSLDCEHRKLDKPYLAPFDILHVNKNGAVTIQKGRTELKVSTRQLHPFWRRG